MRFTPLVCAVTLAMSLLCGSLQADPASDLDARMVVTGWLVMDPEPLGAALGSDVLSVETFTDVDEQPVYYVVYLQPSGFVVVPADDLVEPIIAFADEGTYNPSGNSPIGTLVTQDVSERLAAARMSGAGLRIQSGSPGDLNREKWQTLHASAVKTQGNISAARLKSISDVRVAPLTKTKWAQGSLDCYPEDKPCYNYYAPNHYLCGCVATAMAQLMYYHKHPTHYTWDRMALAPNCNTDVTVLKAIGGLCRDAGTSVNMEYGPDGSSAFLGDAVPALLGTFGYTNAVYGWRDDKNIGAGLIGMINPNLDGGYPVMVAMWGTSPKGPAAHTLLVDGYGYNLSTHYHHLNVGPENSHDEFNVWYNLDRTPPNIDMPGNNLFDSIEQCVYNIFPPTPQGYARTGEIISGRVTDQDGNPLPDTVLTAVAQAPWFPGVEVEQEQPVAVEEEQLVEVEPEYPGVEVEPEVSGWSVTTNSKGIYAFVGTASGTTYTISAQKDGYQFASQSVTTGISVNDQSTSGNLWGINFQGRSDVRTLTVGAAAQQGTITTAGGFEWWQFTASSSATYTIETWTGSLADDVMGLYGPNTQATLIESNDDCAGSPAAKIVRWLSPGTYYVKVWAYHSTATGTYTIRVTSGSGTVLIWGYVRFGNGQGLSNVNITRSDLGEGATTDASGYYNITVPSGWSGTLTPKKTGYVFDPTKKQFSHIVTNQSCDFLASTSAYPVTISGHVQIGDNFFNALSGVTVSASPGNYSDTTGSDGDYSITVPYGWSGTVRPYKTGYLFEPEDLDISDLTSNRLANFKAWKWPP